MIQVQQRRCVIYVYKYKNTMMKHAKEKKISDYMCNYFDICM